MHSSAHHHLHHAPTDTSASLKQRTNIHFISLSSTSRCCPMHPSAHHHLHHAPTDISTALTGHQCTLSTNINNSSTQWCPADASSSSSSASLRHQPSFSHFTSPQSTTAELSIFLTDSSASPQQSTNLHFTVSSTTPQINVVKLMSSSSPPSAL